MMKKIAICLILSLFLIGFVSAANVANFKLPDGFDDVGDGVYIKYDSSKKAGTDLCNHKLYKI